MSKDLTHFEKQTAYNCGLFEFDYHIKENGSMEELLNSLFARLNATEDDHKSLLLKEFDRGLKEYRRLQSVGTGG